jgi:phage minor structural protein
MNYPIYYNKDEVLFEGYGEAILDNCFDVKIDEKLSEEYILTFSAPLDEKTEAISDGFFKVEDTIFIIKKIQTKKTQGGENIVSFDCEHIFFELNDNYVDVVTENFTTERTLYDVINYALGNYYTMRFEVNFNLTTLPDELFKTNNTTANYYKINFSVPSISAAYTFSVPISGSPFGKKYSKYDIVDAIIEHINDDDFNPYKATRDKESDAHFYLVAKNIGTRVGTTSVTYTNMNGLITTFYVLADGDSRFQSSLITAEKDFMEDPPYDKVDIVGKDRKNSIQILKELVETYDLEIKYTNLPNSSGKFYVALVPLNDNNLSSTLPKIGQDNGVQIRYAKNITSMTKTIDMSEVITKLYVYGDNKITIGSADNNPTNLDYIEKPGIIKHKVGFKDFNEETVSNLQNRYAVATTQIQKDEILEQIQSVFYRLYAKGKRYFDEVSVPKISYEIDVVELKQFADYGDLESFDIGDFVTVVDDSLPESPIKLRIVEYIRYPLEPERNEITISKIKNRLSNFLTKVAKSTATTGKISSNITEDVAASAVAGPIKPEQNNIAYFNTSTITNTISFDEDGLKGTKKLGNGDLQTTFHITPEGDATFTGTVEASTIIGSQIIGTSLKTLNDFEDEKGYIEIKYDKPNDESFIQFVDINEDNPSTVIAKTFTPYGDQTKNPTVTLKDGSVSDTYYENMLNIGFKTFENDASHIVSQNKDLIIGVNTGKMIHLVQYGDKVDDYDPTNNTNNIHFPNNGAKINFGDNPTIYGFPTDGSHNHGIDSGRWIMTYDSVGNQLGLQQWVQSGEHNHSGNPDTTPPSNITGFAINGFKHVEDQVLLDFSYSGGVDISSGTSHLKIRGFYDGQPTATSPAYQNTVNGPEGTLPDVFVSKNAIFLRDFIIYGGTVTPFGSLVDINLQAYDHFNNASNTATVNNFNLNTYVAQYTVTAQIDNVGGVIPTTNGQIRFKVNTQANLLEYKNNLVGVQFVNLTNPDTEPLQYVFEIGSYILSGNHLPTSTNIDASSNWLATYNITLQPTTSYRVDFIYKNPRYISPFYLTESEYKVVSQNYTTA